MPDHYWSSILARRLSRRRALAGAGAAAFGGALLAACGGDDGGGEASREKASGLVTQAVDESKTARRGGTWLDFQTADFQTFDPHFTSLPHPSRFMFSTLMRIKPGLLEPARGDYMLDAAASYELSPDKLNLTMKLRPNHKWHTVAPVNGRQVEAEDVLYSYDRLIKMGANRDIFDAARAGPIESISAPDKQTIVFKLNQVYAGILALFAGGGSGNLLLLPKEAEGGYDSRRVAIGSGPWKVGDYQPSVGTVWKRHEGWYDQDILYVDEIRAPVVSEYAVGLAQFKTGGIYRYDVRSDDVLSTKKDAPSINLYQNDAGGGGPIFFFGWNPALGDKTPFRDQRLRQAFSNAIDRDLWIEAFFNVSTFEKQGFAMETAWHSALTSSLTGWWMDPRSKDFGPNARYYKHDPAEAKKLLAAAGFPSGIDIEFHLITSSNYGVDFQKRLETITNFGQDVGMRYTRFPIDFNTEWRPKFADNQGNFPGLTGRNLASGHPDVCEKAIQVFTPDGGVLYTGFFSPDSTYQKGDPKMTALLKRTRTEFDQEKRVAIMKDFQRMAAETQYIVYVPGSASSFTPAWPALRNQNIWRGEVRPYIGQWLDPTKAPIAKT
jgi:peptide/nickel transport system substrate-binding protein